MKVQHVCSRTGSAPSLPFSAGGRLRPMVIAALGLAHFTVAFGQEASNAAANSVQLEEIVVTGTLIRGVAPTGSDLVTVTREDIIASGVTTTAELFATVPQITSFNTAAANVSPLGASFASPFNAPSLRGVGLGATSTLVLVNGHRMVGSGVLQTIPDPSAIPPAAIERVEVVADGASALYGSDAVGGVINMILRKDFEGVETSAQYGAGDGFDTTGFSALFGTAWTGGSAMLAYDYSGRSNLLGADRDYVTADFRSAGRTDTRSSSCWPGNVVAGTPPASYSMPGLQPGVNRCDTVDYNDLLPSEHRNSLFGTVRHEISERVEIFGEAYYSKRKSRPLVTQPGVSFGITSANPFFVAPPGTGAVAETIQYSFVREFGPTFVNPQELTASGIVAGLNVGLAGDWKMEVFGNYGVGKMEAKDSGLNTAALLAAAAGTTIDTALDPFGARTNPAVLARIRSGGSFNEADQQLHEVAMKFDGPLFTLPGGEVRMAVGAQWHYEEIDAATFAIQEDTTRNRIARSYGDRTVRSAFAEVHVPIVGSDNAITGVRSLELSLAGRYDDYSDFGDTTNPKFGLSWRPIDSLTLRASAGSSFHAPSLSDSNVSTVDSRLQIVPFLPFFPPGAPPGPAIVIAGGQPGLDPEQADTWSVGFDFKPAFLDGLNISGTLYNIDFKDVLAIPTPAIGLFVNPALAQYFIYRPTREQLDEVLAMGLRIDGALTPQLEAAIIANGEILDLRRRNLARQEVQGVDFNINYRWNTSAGIVFAGVAGQRELKFDLTAAPGSPVVPQMDRGRVKWRARGTLSWIGETMSAGAFINYTGEYVNPNLLAQTVDDFVTVDLHVSYSPQVEGWLKGTQLTLTADNVLDEEPPLYLFSPGYDAGNSSALGRVLSINVRKSW